MFARSSLFGGDAFAKTMKYSIGEVETIDGSALTAQVPRYQIFSAMSEHVAGDYRVKVTGFWKKVCGQCSAQDLRVSLSGSGARVWLSA